VDRFLVGIPLDRLGYPERTSWARGVPRVRRRVHGDLTLLPVDGGNLAFNVGGSKTW